MLIKGGRRTGILVGVCSCFWAPLRDKPSQSQNQQAISRSPTRKLHTPTYALEINVAVGKEDQVVEGQVLSHHHLLVEVDSIGVQEPIGKRHDLRKTGVAMERAVALTMGKGRQNVVTGRLWSSWVVEYDSERLCWHIQ